MHAERGETLGGAVNRQIDVVGAGLSGLVAAINLARRGYDVRVLEKEKGIGGSPLHHPSAQGTCLRPADLYDYIGVDLGGVVEPMRAITEVAAGKVIPVDISGITPYFFERGPRPASAESLLYELARDAGVEFAFGRPVLGQEELALLPYGTVVATGWSYESFDALSVPYLTSHHVSQSSECDAGLNFVNVYHDDFTVDYGYTSAFHGIRFAHLFNRYRPVSSRGVSKFAGQVFEVEGVELDPEGWNHFTLPLPAARINNPRLFRSNKVLAGSLSGALDPLAFYGLHGALVSGKIASLAVEDKEMAWREFQRCNCLFANSWLMATAMTHTPARLRSAGFGFMFRNFRRLPWAGKGLLMRMPGAYNCYRKRSS